MSEEKEEYYSDSEYVRHGFVNIGGGMVEMREYPMPEDEIAFEKGVEKEYENIKNREQIQFKYGLMSDVVEHFETFAENMTDEDSDKLGLACRTLLDMHMKYCPAEIENRKINERHKAIRKEFQDKHEKRLIEEYSPDRLDQLPKDIVERWQ